MKYGFQYERVFKMIKLALIDDDKEARTTLKRAIDLHLPDDNWECIDNFPLLEINEYSSWIITNNIAALIIDEKLQVKSNDDGEIVDYLGHDLIDFLRKRFPTLPLYVVSAFSDVEEITERFKDVENIINRTDFTNNAEGHVLRIVRSGQKFIDTYQDELTELSDLSIKIIQGEATESDEERIKAIRLKFNFAFFSDTFYNNNEIINKIDSGLQELEKLKNEIQDYIISKNYEMD